MDDVVDTLEHRTDLSNYATGIMQKILDNQVTTFCQSVRSVF